MSKYKDFIILCEEYIEHDVIYDGKVFYSDYHDIEEEMSILELYPNSDISICTIAILAYKQYVSKPHTMLDYDGKTSSISYWYTNGRSTYFDLEITKSGTWLMQPMFAKKSTMRIYRSISKRDTMVKSWME